jgi:hypothetical protein
MDLSLTFLVFLVSPVVGGLELFGDGGQQQVCLGLSEIVLRVSLHGTTMLLVGGEQTSILELRDCEKIDSRGSSRS